MAQADGYVLPNPAVPKTLGILNVIFAVISTALGVCGVGFVLLLPTIQQYGQQQMAQARANEERERAAELKTLDDRAAAATSDEDKATIARERDEVAKRPSAVPSTPDLAAIPTDPRTMALVIAQAAWNLILAVVLLVSGIGLIRLKGWGRKACLAWAVLSIATTVGLAAYSQVAGPGKAANQEQLAKFREAAAKPNATPGDIAAARFADLADRYAIVLVLSGVLFWSAYPTICLILLNTPRARAACLPGASADDARFAGDYTLPPGA